MAPIVLRITALPAASLSAARLSLLPEIPVPASLLLATDGGQHLLFHDAGRSLQLAIDGASVLGPVRLLSDAILDLRYVGAHFSALEILNDLCVSGRLRARHFPPEPRGRRLRVILRALDGWLAGASYRDIAVALFGPTRVREDWADPRGHLRDRVRRAIRRGRALMRGGYLQFLR